jgi:predicted amidohydrolase
MNSQCAVRVACVQLCPGDQLEANIAAALALSARAAREGAKFILLPEYAFFLHASGRAMRAAAWPAGSHPAVAAFTWLAREHAAMILLGSIAVSVESERMANRSCLIATDGKVYATYDKLHMFDATLPSGRTIRESSMYRPGSQAVAAVTPWGMLGMSICYDLRFPQLYRALAQRGCEMLAVPSAFTEATGRVHWHALLRARAIENAAFVLAPATCGVHPGGHATYGHSMIVAPSGEILAEAGDEPCVIFADIDIEEVVVARAAIPALLHDRPFAMRIEASAADPLAAAH